MKNKEPDFERLSYQLRCPFGDDVEEMADNMFQSNSNMIAQTIYQLKLTDNSQVLEIGFANGKHLSELLQQADNIHYQGVEISADMVKQAIDNNQAWIDKQQANFLQVVENEPLPFAKASFDACFSANTIYFWQKPQEFINEIFDLLKEGGKFAISIIAQEFAQQLPLKQELFNFYQPQTIVNFLQQAGFQQLETHAYTEQATSKFGGVYTRPFFVIIAVK